MSLRSSSRYNSATREAADIFSMDIPDTNVELHEERCSVYLS